MKIVTLNYDDIPESPNDWGSWKLYSFQARHVSYRNPNDFFPEGKPTIGFRRKLDVGLAFVLSYGEHGTCRWFRQGTSYCDPWDTTRFAGILVWENSPKDIGAKSYEDRAKDADSFLETYTNWCNGNVYGFDLDEEVVLPCGHTKRENYTSCYGFYDVESLAQEVAAIVRGDQVRFEGDAKYLSNYYDFVGVKP